MKLSPYQLDALRALAQERFGYGVAGWGNSWSGIQYWPTFTILALEKRGLCSIRGRGIGRQARITRAGRALVDKLKSGAAA